MMIKLLKAFRNVFLAILCFFILVYGIQKILSLQALYDYQDSVFVITDIPVTGSGTAFKVEYDDEDYIMTNAHVCATNKKMIIANKNRSPIILYVLYVDYDKDLCILNDFGDITIKSFKINNMNRFDMIYTIGYPNGNLSSSAGIKIQKNESYVWHSSNIFKTNQERILLVLSCRGWGNTFIPVIDNKSIICLQKMILEWTTLYAAPGASGSPVFDKFGFLKGVMNSTDRFYRGSYIDKKLVIKFMEKYLND